MIIEYASFCEKGKREVNQDAVFAAASGDHALFVLADGMGGHSHGQVASHQIVDALSEYWNYTQSPNAEADFEEVIEQYREALFRVNKELYNEYASNGIIVGSTVVVLIIWENEYFAISVGDSHLYHLEDKKLSSMLIDDIWDNLPEIKDAYTEEEKRADSRHGKLTEAVGPHENIRLNEKRGIIEGEKTFLLCSDGVYKFADEKAMMNCMKTGFLSENSRLAKLKKNAMKNKTNDNYSAILCRIKSKQ